MTFLRGSLPRTLRLILLVGIAISIISYIILLGPRSILSMVFGSCPKGFPEYLESYRTWDISPGKEFPEGFQPVDTTNQTYVFSAYIDVLYRGSPGIIRIVALSLTNPTCRQPLFCIMRNSQKTWLVKAVFSLIPEHHNYRYSAAFIICPLKSSAVPSSVSVVSSKEKFTLNKLFVPPLHHGLEVNFTVCVAPLHGNYDDLPQLIEFLEVNEILGANKVIFYNHSVSSRVSDILNKYNERGLVEVIDWHLPFEAYTLKREECNVSYMEYFNVHYMGQLAAANDCLYRNRYKTQYIVSVDLDEFLIPRLARSWFDLKSSLVRLYPSAGAFMFRSYLFYTFLANHSSFFPKKTVAVNLNSLTLLKTNRTLSALPEDIRAKYFYDPKRVLCVGIHNVWDFLDGFADVAIEPAICSINHYRNSRIWSSLSIADMYMHNYQDEIADRLNIRWTEFSTNQSKQLSQSKNRV